MTEEESLAEHERRVADFENILGQLVDRKDEEIRLLREDRDSWEAKANELSEWYQEMSEDYEKLVDKYEELLLLKNKLKSKFSEVLDQVGPILWLDFTSWLYHHD